MLFRSGRVSRRVRHFPTPTRISCRPDENGKHFLITVASADRNGLLYTIAYTFASFGLEVLLARISTLGERIEDIFLVRGAALADARQRNAFEAKLQTAIDGERANELVRADVGVPVEVRGTVVERGGTQLLRIAAVDGLARADAAARRRRRCSGAHPDGAADARTARRRTAGRAWASGARRCCRAPRGRAGVCGPSRARCRRRRCSARSGATASGDRAARPLRPR